MKYISIMRHWTYRVKRRKCVVKCNGNGGKGQACVGGVDRTYTIGVQRDSVVGIGHGVEGHEWVMILGI